MKPKCVTIYYAVQGSYYAVQGSNTEVIPQYCIAHPYCERFMCH